jgi:hypothetical protein
MAQLINIKGQKEFTAGGRTYRFEGLSVERWIKYQKLQVELAYGISPSGLFDKMRELYALINQQRFADAAVQCYNMMEGVAKLSDERTPVALQLAALICNYDGEDVTTITEVQMEEKIKHWQEAGVDMTSFFPIALSSIEDISRIYSESIQSISQKQMAQTRKDTSSLKQKVNKEKSNAQTL